MNRHILSKFGIYAATFVINGLMLAGVNYLFNGQTQQHTDWLSLASNPLTKSAPGLSGAPTAYHDTFASASTP